MKEFTQFQTAQLVKVLRAQHDGSVSGWWDVFCIENESHGECFQGSVKEFAAKLVADGWVADSITRFTALCPACQNPEPTLTEREIWEDQAVYAARGK